MVDIPNLTQANLQRWQQMNVTASLIPQIDKVAQRLIAAKSRYQTVSDTTDVPWHVIAVIHERESSQNFKTNLAQGDPFDQVSTHVPAGRGPFATWEDAAIDALTLSGAAKWSDWSIGGTLTLLEKYNGFGYANRNLPSPYVWASTDQYVKGKFVADGKFDPDAVDKQLGCAAMLSRMSELDNTIDLGAEA
jgi:lysozyme family protein